MWPDGIMVKVLDLRLQRSRVRFPVVPLSGNKLTTLGKLFTHTYASVAKQYKLVPITMR